MSIGNAFNVRAPRALANSIAAVNNFLVIPPAFESLCVRKSKELSQHYLTLYNQFWWLYYKTLDYNCQPPL